MKSDMVFFRVVGWVGLLLGILWDGLLGLGVVGADLMGQHQISEGLNGILCSWMPHPYVEHCEELSLVLIGWARLWAVSTSTNGEIAEGVLARRLTRPNREAVDDLFHGHARLVLTHAKLPDMRLLPLTEK
ncbi:hypothetical protein RCH09_003504 [Actimicrobium sp. GrIS 1.19]|uniref:hypothetical protein n=1 Tax=Actimicrobium sp. GrIS 1.19 TaxID=3071708 RepID=UPI002DF8DF43|nr:hypothetical protein [Actimicrobium sp. GrIS 1.19]